LNISQQPLLTNVAVANNPLRALKVPHVLSFLDVRGTRMRTLDLRGHLVEAVLDTRNTKMTVRVTDPGAARLGWQTTTGAEVRFTR